MGRAIILLDFEPKKNTTPFYIKIQNDLKFLYKNLKLQGRL